MTSISTGTSAGRFDPLGIDQRTLVTKAILVLAGTAILAAASRIAVPMIPVPITLQTFALAMLGVLYGWRLATITTLAWLGEAMLGIPVLANGSGGLAVFMGPTAGYLASFPLVAALTGYLAEKGWTGHRVFASFLAHFLANLVCLAGGWAWLATIMGGEKAWAVGVLPFILGGAIKSALGAALLRAWVQMKDRNLA
ncbi:biotin transporter BioY [Rhizobium oryzicola]|uniref:Biotin transporter n=1 Tax=Rhizobium oryzicola TaxID=1232668 RepID=A0ABT8SSN6_9HYPH|nr:biotin transporter BioY [Rhizobium oryzicola]MDO1581346.1 biotin transporter BioY [Rhizobium oryzicola]